MSKERFDNLNGVRAYACLGIVLMHVLYNGKYNLSGFVFDLLIPSFTQFVFLFMLLSAFSLCCGYYEKFKNGQANLEHFYIRRYQRIWPFFAFLCTIEMLLNHSLKAFYEWIADLSLAFGFIPENGIEVVGVGWFLGTVFIFYMVFPFFVFLIRSKRHAWLAMGIALILHTICVLNFQNAAERSNIVFSSIFFVAGGLIYLYRYKFTRKIGLVAVVISLVFTALYFTVSDSEYTLLILFSSIAIACIACKGNIARALLQNKVAAFVGKLSLEIYLCHMFVFRALEKIGLTLLFHDPIMNYFMMSMATFLGAIVFAYLWQQLYKWLTNNLIKKKSSEL